MALTRTYEAEWSTIGADESIVDSIRGRIGDRTVLKRYYIPTGTDSPYIMDDNVTFTDSEYKFWPYSLSVNSTTVTSGVDVLSYHFLQFSTVSGNDLTAYTCDFWVETFYLSDFEIWTSYLNVDLTDLVTKEECITEQMEILKAAVDLVPALRASKFNDFYSNQTVRDNDTEYRRDRMSGADPFKDLEMGLQQELNKMIDKCNKTPYFGGIRIE